LGNSRHVLSPGVVCDRCNNYFSREVEKPFLESPAIIELRFNQAVGSKKGRVPSVGGLVLPGPVAAKVWRRPFPDHSGLHLDLPEEYVDQFLTMKSGRLIVPKCGELPSGPVVSRFMAKVALEAMAAKLARHPNGVEYLVNETQLDLIRNHARRGETREWPVNQREIYGQDATWIDELNHEVQILHEFDVLMTDTSEWYFVMALFGIELVINYGGPELDGYNHWLVEHQGVSPLYSDKNSFDTRLRRPGK